MKRILTYLLYGLPVLFFVICYFLMTVWGEDIIQGAGTSPDIWNDLVGAFNHNSRLSDMYAWTVINFFDYQYSFGVDTIFRVIDVLMATGVIYLVTTIILSRRPKLKLQDALIFALSFLIIFLTPHGYTLYRGFSVIHNYLIISLTTLLFVLPFVRHFTDEKVPKIYQNWLGALLIGLVFGMSSNITPIAFLISFVLIKLGHFYISKNKAKKSFRKMPAWQGWMIGGMLITVAVAYIFGAGVSSYANNAVYTETYDYLSFGEIFQSFGSSLIRIIKHIAVNFGYSFGLCGLMAMLAGGLAWIVSKIKSQKFRILPQDKTARQIIVLCVVFAAVYLLCGTQIMLPVRLALPAYLALTVVLGVLCKSWWLDSGLVSGLIPGAIMIVLVAIMVIVKAKFALDYRVTVRQILTIIEKSPESAVCISSEIAKPKKLPFVNLGQDETFAEWALPYMTVYGHQVDYCQE